MSRLSIDEFWAWFGERQAALSKAFVETAVNEVYEHLIDLDDGLAVEISIGSPRTVVFSAQGDDSRFGLVRALVASAPSFDSWRFVALKQGRGFGFTVRRGNLEINAAELAFLPLRSKKLGRAGVRIYFNGPIQSDPELDEDLWLILETGIGEELASQVDHIEAASGRDRPSGALPMSELPAFLAWHADQ